MWWPSPGTPSPEGGSFGLGAAAGRSADRAGVAGAGSDHDTPADVAGGGVLLGAPARLDEGVQGFRLELRGRRRYRGHRASVPVAVGVRRGAFEADGPSVLLREELDGHPSGDVIRDRLREPDLRI